MFIDDEFYIPDWLRKTLVAAGVYNIIWGLLVLFFPDLYFDRFNLALPEYSFLWQLLGIIAIAMGIGYLITSNDILRFWPVILIGFLIKLVNAAGFGFGILNNTIPIQFIWTILFNSVIWLIPFAILLNQIYRQFIYEFKSLEDETFLEMEFNLITTNRGKNLKELSDERPVVLIFLRHFGCTFCKEMLEDIAKNRENLESDEKELVLIHMSDYDNARKMLNKYGLGDVHHISDIYRDLYRYFGLRRGYFMEVFGIKIWLRGAITTMFKGHKVGKVAGDAFQLPGIFIYYKGRIIKKFIHKSAADRPDYKNIANCEIA